MVIPRIMPGLPNVLWPTFFKGVRNWIQANFLIRPHFDREFGLDHFITGARQAFLTVSNRIAEGDTKSLEGLLTDEALGHVKQSSAVLQLSDREKFKLKNSDIYLAFPYQVGIIMPDQSGKRWVEIMVVYHTLRGFADLQKQNISLQELQQENDRFLFANFRFSRDYSKDVSPEESTWTINYLNYFNPETGSQTEIPDGKDSI